MSSLREQILTANDLNSETVEVPEWGKIVDGVLVPAKIKVKGLSRGALAKLLKECADENGNTDNTKFPPRLLIATMVDPLNDQPLFTAADSDALDSKSIKSLGKVTDAAMRVCGLSGVEQAEKNSEQTGSGGSLSVSQNDSVKP